MATSQSGETEQFAYGTNQTDDGCECPAVAAGFDPDNEGMDGMQSMVGRYDMEMETEQTQIGTAEEERAREGWMEALEHSRQLGIHDAVEVGEEVAEELGWLDE